MRTSVLVVSAEPVGDAHGRAGDPRLRAGAGARGAVRRHARRPGAEHGRRPRLAAARGRDGRRRGARRRRARARRRRRPGAAAGGARAARRRVPSGWSPTSTTRSSVEVLDGAAARSRRGAAPDPAARSSRARSALCAAADLVICANERQRDLLDRRDGAARADRPGDLRARPDAALARRRRAVRAARRAAARADGRRCARRSRRSRADDRVLLWGGGVWDWLDAVTPMRAVERLDARPSTSSCWALGRPALEASGQAAAGEAARRGRARRRPAGHARARQPRLGAVRGARRVAGRGRPRRLRAPRPPRGALRAPHARCSTTCGPGCRWWPRAATRSPSWSSASGSARRSRRATRRASRRRARGCSGPTAPPRASAIAAAGAGAALERGGRAARRVVRDGSRAPAPRAPRRRRGARRSRSTGGRSRRRWATTASPRAARRVGRRLRRAVRPAMRRLDRVELAVLVALAGFSRRRARRAAHQGPRAHRRRRPARLRPAPVLHLDPPGGRARADRQRVRHGARPPGLPAPRLPALRRRCTRCSG